MALNRDLLNSLSSGISLLKQAQGPVDTIGSTIGRVGNEVGARAAEISSWGRPAAGAVGGAIEPPALGLLGRGAIAQAMNSQPVSRAITGANDALGGLANIFTNRRYPVGDLAHRANFGVTIGQRRRGVWDPVATFGELSFPLVAPITQNIPRLWDPDRPEFRMDNVIRIPHR